MEQLLGERGATTTGINLSFDKLCKHYNIPFELHDLYHQWLMNLQDNGKRRFTEQQLPRSRGNYLKPGMKVPAPYGQQWRQLMKQKNLKYKDKTKKQVIQANHMIMQAIHNTMEGIKAVQALTEHWDKQDLKEARAAQAVKKRRVKATDTVGGKAPPRSIAKAIRDENRKEAYKWLESINKE